MAIRNPAARNSAVIPAHVTTRILFRGSGFCKRAVYSRGRHIGYTTSHLGFHEAFIGTRNCQEQVFTDGGDKGWPYLSDAVVGVATEADKRLAGAETDDKES